MAKPDPSGSESDESENSGNPSSEEGGEEVGTQKGITEYEKQRLSRIAENKARMEALGLNKMATSLMGSGRKSRQRKGKQKFVDDEEYRPNDETPSDDDDDDLDDDDEDFVSGQSSSKSGRSKDKRKGSKPKKTPVQKHLSSADYIDGDDDELMQAIALSLHDSANDATPKERKGDAHVQEDAGRRKRKKSQFSSRVQMTEDDLVLHFFQFDESQSNLCGKCHLAEAGRGAITMRDLRRVAITHDFTWTDQELADMIHCFDGDGDGKSFMKIAIVFSGGDGFICTNWVKWSNAAALKPVHMATLFNRTRVLSGYLTTQGQPNFMIQEMSSMEPKKGHTSDSVITVSGFALKS
ncbi:unnamed protein product [Dovyalis caffra]|uniref:Uncharacterized protein n=1 Tax=Dovyalis caffra TaxID=77055 RepID=A0AAV1SA91_9ROSI|nr:unnamed protein product [Dovyalis caffra]